MGVRLHGLEDVVGLVGHGLAGGAHEAGAVGATRDAGNDAPGVRTPPGRAKTREGRDDVAAARVWHGARKHSRLCGVVDEAQPIPQPLDDRASLENGALERIVHAPALGDADRQTRPFVEATDSAPVFMSMKQPVP